MPRRTLRWVPLLVAMVGLAACVGAAGDPVMRGALALDAGPAAADAAAPDADPIARADATPLASPDAGALPVDVDGGDALDAAFDAGPISEPDAGVIAGPDAGPRRVPAFVAVGKQGRRAISCDDGHTWIHDVATDDAWPEAERYRCFSGDFVRPDGTTVSTDCDHNALSSTGLGYGDGVFMHSLGWGALGTFHRSTDGVTWREVFTGRNVQDLMYGDGRWVAATRTSVRSDDDGETWVDSGTIDVSSGGNTIWNVRAGAYGAGSFLVTAQDGENLDFAYSTDRGESWQRPTMVGGGRVDLCGAGAPVEGDGVFVTIAWSQAMNASIVCTSTDGARTWRSTTIADAYMESRALWTGREFMVWSNGRVHTSPDGVAWTQRDTMTRGPDGVMRAGPNIGPVAVSPSGTFVAVRGGWQVWYEQQRFYRSTDGVVWDQLPDAAYRKGHPMSEIRFGLVEPSSECP